MNDREKMLQKVRMYGFAMLDNGLFLNGHPRDASALAYQKKTKALYDQAVREYESNFGPLRMEHADDMTKWNWIEDPWPWEGVDN